MLLKSACRAGWQQASCLASGTACWPSPAQLSPIALRGQQARALRGSQDQVRRREKSRKRRDGVGREQVSHVLLRLRGALASGDQLASITDFI